MVRGYYRYPFEEKHIYLISSSTESARFDSKPIMRDIPADLKSKMVLMGSDLATTITYSFTATAHRETKTYFIKLTNDASANRSRLMDYVNHREYVEIVSSWNNNTNKKVTWTNQDNERMDWIVGDQAWPWKEE